MPSSTVENYTKNIFLVAQDTGHEVVTMGKVAEALGVVPGTATSMVKALAKAGLAEYEPRMGVKLTEQGSALALKILRRHRLVEYFLVEKLKMDWSEIHEEAEALEHAISDNMLDRLDKFLGEPRYDPHGDPIPTSQGELLKRDLVNLTQCQIGEAVIIRRIADQEVSFLNFAQESNLVPGTTLTIVNNNHMADCVEIQFGDGSLLTLGLQAVSKIWVEQSA